MCPGPAATMSNVKFCLCVMLAWVLTSPPAAAVEGSMSTYLLGSRDLLMGVVPPPGAYVGNDVILYSGNIRAATNLAGIVIEDAELDVVINKTTITAVAAGQLLGGSVGFSIVVPFVDAQMDATGRVADIIGGTIDAGHANGLSDITLVPMIGWHDGKLHYSFTLPLYLPTGSYSLASVDLADRSADAINPGKNRLAVDPTFAVTYLDPNTGLELNAALGFTFSAENEATDYQSGAEMHLEATAAQRFQSGWLLGVYGQYYQQIEDDSGAGADQLIRFIRTDDLLARVFGAGPVISYSTKIRDIGVSLTGKYVRQFGAEKHIEGDAGWLRANFSF
jgi:hypothetical protein